MNIRYRVTLTTDERHQLQALLNGGRGAVRKIKRAQILLAADAQSTDELIARTVGVGTSTVYRTKQRFVEEGLTPALSELPRPGAPRKLGARDEALLVAIACSQPPVGRARWTMDLLAGEMVRLTTQVSLSGDTVGRRLAEMKLKPWQEKMWCIPTVNAEYVARMEDVLDLYAEAPDPQRPVVCFDETPRQLIGEARVPIRAEPGKPRRVDYEYVRNGTANVFMFVDVNRPWRHAKVTDHRTCVDFAACMRDLVDEHYPDAERIRVVLDNLSAHSAAALYQAFDPAEARRILKRLEFHFTPKHASWLNMVEIEIGVMVTQCLDRRIPDTATLLTEVAAWEQRRNAEMSRIKWLFTVDRAREKLGRVYPQPAGRTQAAA
ncbi:MAG TPA: IS630 family transposase [Gemmatimonadaceae bacterium]|nr:IS630 family transposase [Gemmatimonadaceae bacterium]